MKTSKPFGFISYNSSEFLEHVLQQFIAEGKFLRCACWYHESTGSEKNHFHCWVEPNGEIDTSAISDKFVEILPNGEQQSIAIRPKCSSKWNDAYLYGIHDSEYLTSKGLERELVNIQSDKHIYLGDFKADLVQAEMYRLKHCLAPYARFKELVYQGKTLEEVYLILRIPFAQFNAVANAYKYIKKIVYDEQQDEMIAEANGLVEIIDKSVFDIAEITRRQDTAPNELPIEDIAEVDDTEE